MKPQTLNCARRNVREHPALKISRAEIWLKIVVHLAGFAALFLTPSVGRLLAYLGDQFGLWR